MNLTITPYDAKEGDTVIMECTVYSEQQIHGGTFNWTMKGKDVAADHRINLTTEIEPGSESYNSLLILKDSSWKDTGKSHPFIHHNDFHNRA